MYKQALKASLTWLKAIATANSICISIIKAKAGHGRRRLGMTQLGGGGYEFYALLKAEA